MKEFVDLDMQMCQPDAGLLDEIQDGLVFLLQLIDSRILLGHSYSYRVLDPPAVLMFRLRGVRWRCGVSRISVL